MKNLNIALIQAETLWEEKENNLAIVLSDISNLPDDTHIAILPETFLSGFTNNTLANSIQEQSIEMQSLKIISQTKKIAIAGSVIFKEGEKIFNRFLFITPDGGVKYYDKKHLFSPADEDQYFSPGNERVVIEYLGWRIFPQICYDLRFPVWSRNNLNYDIVIYVANWPASRKNVWETLLKARAIENQCYVLGVNRSGKDGNEVEYDGRSGFVDFKGFAPWMGDNKKTGISRLKFDKLVEFRKKFPIWKDADRFEIK